ncbi:ABC-F family ATP-binding cassette domain-containing protein [Paenibacillus sp. KQZ6P-2]|uniref:ABC-F family ATP-binding cassette domain-containing protein n=2 Tax=Paenibacillus mangrovi TaxID=2931978 RepID=A0A9X1WTQ0_9BACL|nr:ABC-F family ATP-binding cassette domain-containing protein [Paenibacillus mangrovi]MCJ8011629.1 ABC-F family ATP-binding cassette domain-containing protein [Paenibacillus mangrovi]
MMIQCKNIQKYHGAQLVLSDISFEIRHGEKAALIGRNGSGKTTLFHLLKGVEAPDQGNIAIQKGARIGLLAQIPEASAEETVYDVLLRPFADVLEWQERMRTLEVLMSDPDGSGDPNTLAGWLEEYGKLQERFERADGYEVESSIARVAGGLGIPTRQFSRPFSSLSGGEKTKVGLAVLLLEKPDVLLLDEPTNHLDMGAIQWLEQFLAEYGGTVLAISHDRYFLDRLVTKVIEIEDGEAFIYHTNYSGYQKEKEERLLLQFAHYQEQQKKIKQMQESIKQLIQWGNEANPPNAGFHRRAASMQKALDRMVKLKRPVLERKKMDLQLQQDDRSGKQVLFFDQVGKTFGERSLFNGVNGLLRYGETVMLLGPNGCGKSTLLQMILGSEEVTEGSIVLGSRVSIGYLAQQEHPENTRQTVLQFYRDQAAIEEGEARGKLARFLFYGPDVFKSVSSLSGGEWTRLRFAVLIELRPNLLILDEPTNHLDIDSREVLEEALEEFPGTILSVSHDRYFINRLADNIWSLEQGKLQVIPGGFDEYQSRLIQEKLLEGKEAKTEPVPASSTGKQHASSPKAVPVSWEKDIQETEQQLLVLNEQMLDSSIACDANQLAELYDKSERLKEKLQQLYKCWMDAAE